MKPLNNRYVVQKLPEDQKIGTIEVPATVEPSLLTAQGIVIETPDAIYTKKGIRLEPSIPKGSKVLFQRWCQQVKTGINEVSYLPLESEILAVLE